MRLDDPPPDTIVISPTAYAVLRGEMIRQRHSWWRDDMAERLPMLTKLIERELTA